MEKIILLLIMLPSMLVAQHSPTQASEYNSIVYKAERYLVDNSIELANKAYKKLVKNADVVFSSDLRNAIIVAVRAGDKKNLAHLLKIATNRKQLWESITTDNKLAALITAAEQSEAWKSMPKSYDSTSMAAALVIDSIFGEDQRVRRSCPGYNPKCVKTVMEVDSSNMKKLVYLASFKTIVDPYDYGANSVNFKIYVIIKHARQWGIVWLDSMLTRYAANNYLKAIYVADIFDYKSNADSVNTKYLKNLPKYGLYKVNAVFNDTILHYDIKDSLKAVINSNRKKINLYPIDDEYDRWYFYKSNQIFNSWDLGIVNFSFNGLKEADFKRLVLASVPYFKRKKY